jgi:hypothetical protein
MQRIPIMDLWAIPRGQTIGDNASTLMILKQQQENDPPGECTRIHRLMSRTNPAKVTRHPYKQKTERNGPKQHTATYSDKRESFRLPPFVLSREAVKRNGTNPHECHSFGGQSQCPFQNQPCGKMALMG